MTATLKTLEKVREINSAFPYTDPVRQWKAQGKKVIGWSCIYVPEEIIHAAGMLPFRITGDSEELALDNANAYIYSGACSFMRSCFELGISHQFDFLDGYVPSSVCQGIIRLGELWERYIPNIPVIHMIGVPRKLTESGCEFYQTEVLEFKRRIEEFAGVEISDESLRESIALYDRTRELLGKLYDLRKADNPPVTGAEMLELVNAAVRMPREPYNQLLEELLAEINQTRRSVSGEIRLMLGGSVCNNPELMSGIESLDAIVVIDELCTGARYFMDRVVDDPGLSSIEVISRRYFNVFPCARSNPASVRIDRIVQLAKDYHVDGVLMLLLRSCPGIAYDQPLLREKLEENEIPVFELDVEYGMALTGPIRVRVEAFLETLGLLP